jgi:hypothetical protein
VGLVITHRVATITNSCTFVAMAGSRVNRRVIAVLALVVIALLLSQLFKYGPVSKSGKLHVYVSCVLFCVYMVPGGGGGVGS